MKVKDIYSFLDKIYPFNTALDFDNAGLLIGDESNDVKTAVIALDCTESALETAIKNGASLIITHHPVIFSGLKSIPEKSIHARLIKNGISVISAHTNLDIAAGGVNDCLCNTLELENISEIVGENGYSFCMGVLKSEFSPEKFSEYLKEKLNFSPRFVCGKGNIKTVAVCGGAGADCLEDAVRKNCDAFVTSEVKHHIFLNAESYGISLYDCGHFATENVVIEPLAQSLRKEFPDVNFITDNYSSIRSL